MRNLTDFLLVIQVMLGLAPVMADNAELQDHTLAIQMMAGLATLSRLVLLVAHMLVQVATRLLTYMRKQWLSQRRHRLANYENGDENRHLLLEEIRRGQNLTSGSDMNAG